MQQVSNSKMHIQHIPNKQVPAVSVFIMIKKPCLPFIIPVLERHVLKV